MDKTAIRDAATIVVLRDRTTNPSVLMGQRGASAAFMPNKFVFPGGAVDDVDLTVPVAGPMHNIDHERLSQDSTLPPVALANAAIRELWEETGHIVGHPQEWFDAPRGWRGFAATGHVPDPSHLHFIFRAVTPVGNPRRFDARFFVIEADHLRTDPDDFSRAEDELAHLQWVELGKARTYDLPFITEVVLAELAANLDRIGPPANVPFFRNDDEAHLVTRLAGRSPLAS